MHIPSVGGEVDYSITTPIGPGGRERVTMVVSFYCFYRNYMSSFKLRAKERRMSIPGAAS